MVQHSNQNLGFVLTCIFIWGVCLSTSTIHVQAIPFHGSLADPVDMCIVACYSCYRGTTLVKCGNECIETNGLAGPTWTKICPAFTTVNKNLGTFFGETMLQ